ncbi:transcriptional regulator, AsnC family [Novosphingobium mathurense]|uniref:Transcriptional regulator, AsnC family n=2 Tax=Sphingomonadaceae TaxID=41297 RepID=A0A1U6HTQ9_9SPHN|nr:Transcriptional regulator, AsnC family [Novosphingobium sp. KN65.2]SLJ99135.1 transcriptional regulator, AsnC family [Novosphingobium mathurense]
MQLDRIDLKIIRRLQEEGRITNVQLAEAVGLSPSPCLARVKRLETAGIIIGYEAQFDLAKLGDFVTAYVQIILKNHRRADAERFEKAVVRHREVVEFHMVNGKFDYLMKIVAAGYDGPARILEELWQADLGMQSYSLFIVSGMPIRNGPLSIAS